MAKPDGRRSKVKAAELRSRHCSLAIHSSSRASHPESSRSREYPASTTEIQSPAGLRGDRAICTPVGFYVLPQILSSKRLRRGGSIAPELTLRRPCPRNMVKLTAGNAREWRQCGAAHQSMRGELIAWRDSPRGRDRSLAPCPQTNHAANTTVQMDWPSVGAARRARRSWAPASPHANQCRLCASSAVLAICAATPGCDAFR
jgi:hypothetical protein